MKPSVGIVTTWFERGAAHVSRQFADALEPACDVHIYARGGEFRAPRAGIWDKQRVTWARRSAVNYATGIDSLDFLRWLDSRKIDLVFFNEQQWWQPVIWAARAGR